MPALERESSSPSAAGHGARVAHRVLPGRLVRRVLKAHRAQHASAAGGAPPAMALQVPHAHVAVLPRETLLRLVRREDLGPQELPETVILVAQPEVPEAEVARAVWRAAFHGHVHAELERKQRAGGLSEPGIRARIERLGQTEFDEIRAVLAGEDLLFRRGDDREVYVEFAAFYLELGQFAPADREKFFPSLRDPGRVLATLEQDVDAAALLARCRPEGLIGPSWAADAEPHEPASSAAPGALPRRPESAAALLAGAELVRRRGNLARAAILQLQAGTEEGRRGALGDLGDLGRRLRTALEGAHPQRTGEPAPDLEWGPALTSLAEHAASAWSPRSRAARVLLDLQKACVESERERRTVDVIGWLASFGRRPIVRPLPMARPVRVARLLERAFEASHGLELGPGPRRELEGVLRAAVAKARENTRLALLPVLRAVLDEVGLRPTNVPEEVAREKLCAELLDRIRERGFLGLGELRDALSRSNLKLHNLRAEELTRGDALLRADALLALRLDGVYRPGEIYLRNLQRLSGIAFGTRAGRLVSLHVALPLLAAFVSLEAVQHLAHALGKRFGHPHVQLRTGASTLAITLLFYGLLHAPRLRALAWSVLAVVGGVLRAVFVGAPVWLFTRAPVVAVLRSRPFALFARLLVRPALLGVPALLFARHHGLSLPASAGVAGGLFLAAAAFSGTPLGARVEESVTDALVLGLGNLRRHVLPGLVALALDLSRRGVERVDRAIYVVDEWLTFRPGERAASLVLKGAFGALWFVLTYLVRIYVNLLIEPQVNPIKHFPVVTVSHKILLPMAPTLLELFRAPLLPLGAVAANAIAGTTVFLLPGVFGFLVWELKENWRLYAQNRPGSLEPVRIGHHGETMSGLLVVGFHSGTVPKLFTKLRRAARRGAASQHAHRQALHEIEHALTTFFERELVGLLRGTARWTAGELSVHAVVVGSNRVRVGVALGRGDLAEVAWLHFEEQSGWLVASVASPGFFASLAPDQRATMAIALAGIYKLCAVDLVREQVEALIHRDGEELPYDIADEGLVVWPGAGFATEVSYDLRGVGALAPRVRGADPGPQPVLAAERLVFARQPVAWSAWVGAFAASGSTPSVLVEPSVLPPMRASARASVPALT